MFERSSRTSASAFMEVRARVCVYRTELRRKIIFPSTREVLRRKLGNESGGRNICRVAARPIVVGDVLYEICVVARPDVKRTHSRLYFCLS